MNITMGIDDNIQLSVSYWVGNKSPCELKVNYRKVVKTEI